MRPQNLFPGFGRRKSSAWGQKAEVRGQNWRENVFGFFFGPRSKAAVALRSPLSRVRVIRVFDGGGGGERTKGRKGGYKGSGQDSAFRAAVEVAA